MRLFRFSLLAGVLCAWVGVTGCEIVDEDPLSTGGSGGTGTPGTGGGGGEGGAGGSGGGGGEKPNVDGLCDNPGQHPIHLPGTSTARQTLLTAQEIANRALGGSAKWQGGVAGAVIGRNGKPTLQTIDTDVGEMTLEGGWAIGFCAGMDAGLVRSHHTTQADIQCAKNAINCDAVDDYQVFEIDSPEIISKAFPDGADDDVYSLMLVPFPNAWKWEVRRSGDGTPKYVDAVTGEVSDSQF